ncbi:MAG TPA: hypothetical protein VFY80_06705 [Burkholderiales bacterium]|nr:hypothetical protein [Burkholderiales bacterium]
MSANDAQANSVTRDATAEAAVPAIKRSAAQRQRAYRLRRKRAAIEAIGEESAASRVALMTLLAYELAALDARGTPANLIASRRGSVKRILNAIVTRYAIDLSD